MIASDSIAGRSTPGIPKRYAVSLRDLAFEQGTAELTPQSVTFCFSCKMAPSTGPIHQKFTHL